MTDTLNLYVYTKFENPRIGTVGLQPGGTLNFWSDQAQEIPLKVTLSFPDCPVVIPQSNMFTVKADADGSYTYAVSNIPNPWQKCLLMVSNASDALPNIDYVYDCNQIPYPFIQQLHVKRDTKVNINFRRSDYGSHSTVYVGKNNESSKELKSGQILDNFLTVSGNDPIHVRVSPDEFAQNEGGEELIIIPDP